MATDDKVEELIREIAAKHGIAVGRDDPILILQTINARLMQDSQAAQQEILDHFKSELEEIAQRWGDDAKNKSERILNAALTASKNMMSATLKEGAVAAAKAIQGEVGQLDKTLSNKIDDARRVGIMNMIAGSMVLFAASLALIAAL